MDFGLTRTEYMGAKAAKMAILGKTVPTHRRISQRRDRPRDPLKLSQNDVN